MKIEMAELDFSWLWTLPSLATVVVAVTTYGVLLATYRVTLHPLAKFPGPKLAAMTLWYEFYYDVILWGQLTNRIERMHKEYGESSNFAPRPSRLVIRRTTELTCNAVGLPLHRADCSDRTR
jgi:hypothetical protein